MLTVTWYLGYLFIQQIHIYQALCLVRTKKKKISCQGPPSLVRKRLNQIIIFYHGKQGFPGGSVVKNPPAKAVDNSLKITWRRKWQSTPVLLPGKSHGQRSLAGYSPWGHKESDTTMIKRLSAGLWSWLSKGQNQVWTRGLGGPEEEGHISSRQEFHWEDKIEGHQAEKAQANKGSNFPSGPGRKYIWSLKNTSLNCMSPLICIFFQ